MKFFNSDKSGFLSFVAKRMKALFALLFIIAGTSSVWGQNPELPWTYASEMSGWADAVGKSEYTFIRQDVVFAGNNYTHYLDIEFQSAGTDNYKLIEDGKNWYGMETTIPYQCKWWEWKSGAGNTAFQHNAGKYRFYINANSDQRKITVTGIFVTIDDEPVNNGDGTYTITGHYTNANPDQQIINSRQIVFTEGSGSGVGANENATDNGDGSFSFTTPKLTERVQYTCNARIVDGAIGNHDSESVTFIAEAGQGTTKITPTEESYSVTWAEPVYDAEAGTVVLSATVAAAENAGFALADGTFEAQINVAGLASSARTILSESNQYTISHTISGVAANQQIDYSLQIVTGGSNPLVNASDVQNLNPQTYTVPEAEPEQEPEPEPVSLYLIGAGTSAQWVLADALPFTYENGVYTWTGNLTKNNEAFKILTSNKEWEPAYVAETDQFKVDLGEAIDLHYREKLGDNQYTCDDNKFKITEDDEYTIKVMLGADNSGSMIVTKKSDPVYAATITADASASQETAGQVALTSSLTETSASTDLATATCVFQYKAADAGDETYADMSEPASVIYSGEGATRTATLSQSMAAGDYVFRAVWTYNSAEVANAVTGTVTIPSDTPTPTDIEFYVRGEKIGCTPSEGGDCWGVASEEFKATSKEGNVYVWNWTTEPKLMVGPFKIADANFSDANNYGLDNKTTINLTDGKWTGTLQVNTASGDMIISEPGWNVSKITFDYDTKILEIFATPVFKDIWFRSDIVQPGGWNNDTTDPIDAGIDAKWQGHTSDGVVYTWDWSGADAVELSSDTEFKFGEYSGSNWAANGYAPDGEPQITLANMGTEIPVLNGVGNFSAGGDIIVTRMTLDIEKLTLVVKGEAFRPLANAQVVVERSEIGSYSANAELSSLRVGDKVIITASFNEGYETGYSVSFSAVNCDMEDVEGNANAKTFTITAENPVITLTFMSSCQKLEDRFTISGQFNRGMDPPWVGEPINSGEADPANGCFAGGDEGDTNLFNARTFTLTDNSVPANYFEWECAGYALDGTSKDIPEITWANQYSRSATATVNLPGTYTFRLKARCNESDEWTNSAELTITAPVPQIGFDGADGNIGGWKHAWAGQADGGLMTRQPGTLIWKSNAFTLGNLASEFVIIQRYKLGCVGTLDGWDGYNENGCNYRGNKINYAHLTLNGINGGTGGNFTASNTDAWVANETQLQLTVTMTGWDSYTVELAEYKNIIATATTEPADGSRGTVSMAAPDGTIIPSGSNVADYVGQQVTLTATPAHGYKVASWEINGKVTESDRTTISPTLSGEGLNVVVTFKRDCYSGVVYDLNGGGIICATEGSTELSLNTLNNVTYQLYRDGEAYGEAVPGDGKAAKWTISKAGTYTAKAYDSRYEECEEQAMDMNKSAVVTTVTAPKITVNPGANVHLTVLQARSFTADVPVDWSITEVKGSGDYCDGDGYMISSQTDTSLVAKFLCVGTAKITATMKAPNENCMAEVTVHQNGAETEACAPEPEDMQ